MQLSDLKKGEKAVITKINCSSRLTKTLESLGVVKGVNVTMIRKAPMGDPIELSIFGSIIALRRMDAKNILVEKTK